MNNFPWRKSLISVAVCAAAGSSLPLVYAAPGTLEEVMVTAQKREQSMQDIGISVAAFSGEQMGALGWSSSEDVAAQVPGLTTSKTAGAAVSQFNIRGVGQADFADHHEAPNAIYLDQAYVAAPGAAGFPMFDLNRVEVLRGPQGTLFGRNATGGLVHFISNTPTDELEGYIRVDAGEYSLVRTEGAISGALSDNIQGRLAGYYANADGWVENDIGDDLRSQDTWAARGLVNFDISQDTHLLVKVQGFSEDVDAGIYKSTPSFTDENGVNQFAPAPEGDFYGYRDPHGSPHKVSADQIGLIEKDVYGSTWLLEHDFSEMTLTSVTDYSTAETAYREDTDSSPFNQTTYDSTMDVSQFSQELRLNGETDQLIWVAGLYYLDIEGDYFARFDLPTLAGFFDPDMFPGDGSGTGEGTGAANQSEWTLDTTSWSVFGQGEWALSQQFSLIAGLRWTEDDKDYKINADCYEEAEGACAYVAFAEVGDVIVDGINLGPAVTDIDGPVSLSRSDNDWSGRLQLDYRPNDDVLLFASVNKGIKGGGFTTPLDGLLAVPQLPYEPEEIFAYEMGIKSSLWDGRARLNASLFYYDYSDLQTFEFRGVTSVVLNQDAEFFGGEVELTLSPGSGWDVILGGAYLDAEVKDVETPQGEMAQKPINAPELKLNWLVRKSFAITDGMDLSIQYDGNYTDDRYFNIVNAPTVFAPDYTVQNLRVSLDENTGKWGVSAWVKNLSDEEYITHTFDLTVLGYTIQKFGAPRWAGVTVNYNF